MRHSRSRRLEIVSNCSQDHSLGYSLLDADRARRVKSSSITGPSGATPSVGRPPLVDYCHSWRSTWVVAQNQEDWLSSRIRHRTTTTPSSLNGEVTLWFI